MVQFRLFLLFPVYETFNTQKQKTERKFNRLRTHQPLPGETWKSTESTEEFFSIPEAEKVIASTHTYTKCKARLFGKKVAREWEEFILAQNRFSKKHPPRGDINTGINSSLGMCAWRSFSGCQSKEEKKENFSHSINFACIFHIKKLKLKFLLLCRAQAWSGITNISVCVVVLLLWPLFPPPPLHLGDKNVYNYDCGKLRIFSGCNAKLKSLERKWESGREKARCCCWYNKNITRNDMLL